MLNVVCPPITPPPATEQVAPGRVSMGEDSELAELEPAAIWERIIRGAVRERASDVHLSFQGEHIVANISQIWTAAD